MTKKEYFELLKSNGLMNKTELELTEENKNKENTFIEKVPKATGYVVLTIIGVIILIINVLA